MADVYMCAVYFEVSDVTQVNLGPMDYPYVSIASRFKLSRRLQTQVTQLLTLLSFDPHGM